MDLEKLEIKNKNIFYYTSNINNLRYKKNCFIILGHEINKISFELSESSKERCDLLASLVEKKSLEDYLIIFMGLGRPNLMGDCNFTISECMYNYFCKNYFKPQNCIIDQRSMDTVGDAVFSYLILKKIKFNGLVSIVSSDWHIKRVKSIFSKIYEKNFKLEILGTSEIKNMDSNTKNSINKKEEESSRIFFEQFSSYDKSLGSIEKFLELNHKLY